MPSQDVPIEILMKIDKECKISSTSMIIINDSTSMIINECNPFDAVQCKKKKKEKEKVTQKKILHLLNSMSRTRGQ